MTLLRERHLNIDYWDLTPRATSASKIQVEEQLKLLASNEVRTIKNFSDLNTSADLFIVDALIFDDEEIAIWFKKLHRNILAANAIWVPTIIVTDNIDFVLDDFNELIASNWYFDFLHPEHVTSLPIRCINLIKMHDHLQEIHKYSEQLSSLEAEVEKIKKGSAND